MKKIFNICLLPAVTADFVACSDDSDAGSNYSRENPTQVVNSKLTFITAAQKGGVKFTAPAGSTVSVSDSWVTALLQNDSIVVSVTNNPAIDSRSAVLTIKDDRDSTNLPILQAGVLSKYKGTKYYAASDKDTTLTLPYTALDAEPSMELADASDASGVASIENKDSAFVAHIGANTTGEVRTFSFVSKNQENRDTITVIRGDIDDLAGKIYSLYGYDPLKITSSTTDIKTLVTQIVGTPEKKSDTELTSNSSDTGMKMTLTFDPAKVSLSLKAGKYILSKRVNDTAYFYRTAIWDVNHYGIFMKLIRQQTEGHNAGKVSDTEFAAFQKVVPDIYNCYVSNQLTMTARTSYFRVDKMVAGILEDSGKNAAYIKSLEYLGPLGFPLSSFNGNVFAIYKYNQRGSQLYLNGPLFLLQPVMLFHPLSRSAKPAAFTQKR